MAASVAPVVLGSDSCGLLATATKLGKLSLSKCSKFAGDSSVTGAVLVDRTTKSILSQSFLVLRVYAAD